VEGRGAGIDLRDLSGVVKAMHAASRPGQYVLGQASCLQKLVEGGLHVDRPEPLPGNVVPWDADPYRMCDWRGGAGIQRRSDGGAHPVAGVEVGELVACDGADAGVIHNPGVTVRPLVSRERASNMVRIPPRTVWR